MNKDLRIVFMGTPEFAVASLAALYDASYHIVGVITTADKKAGRGKRISVSAVKQYALEKKIPVLTPLNLKDPEFLNALSALKADLQVVVAFRMLPELVWQEPALGTFNLHASLLPQYRGAAPINHAIINGETETGVTTFFLDKEIDTGRIIAQQKCKISPEDSAGDLHDSLMVMGADLVVQTVKDISNDTIVTKSQNDAVNNDKLRKAPKIFKNDGLIDWEQEAVHINNKIRGLSPYPAAWTILKDMDSGIEYSLKIFSAKILEDKSVEPGKISTDGKSFLRIHTKDKLIDIEDLQLQGKKRMKVDDLLRGFKVVDNMCFVKPNRTLNT